MKFLEIFNEIEKGNYALTDEAIYSSLQNKSDLIPLYGGNKTHLGTDRKISATAKTKKGFPITIFSGEGIIISLDGSAGSMTYKCNEQFALNHHAGFITLRENAKSRVKLEFFAIYLQEFYRNLSVSDGSKTLSLEQIYSEEFELPDYQTQCRVLSEIKKIQEKIDILNTLKQRYLSILEKEVSIEYTRFQAKNVDIKTCIKYISGNTGLTEEFIYQTLQHPGTRYSVLSSATEDRTMMGVVPFCIINNKPLKVFDKQAGLLVTRNGKAGQTKFLQGGKYTINDHAYILYHSEDSPYQLDLRWLSIQYKPQFLQYASSSDNGTWNMTGFFKHTKIDIPILSEQLRLVAMYEKIELIIEKIQKIENLYISLLEKQIA